METQICTTCKKETENESYTQNSSPKRTKEMLFSILPKEELLWAGAFFQGIFVFRLPKKAGGDNYNIN